MLIYILFPPSGGKKVLSLIKERPIIPRRKYTIMTVVPLVL